MNLFFTEVKKIVDKSDEEPIIPELQTSQVQQAKFAEKEKKIIRFLCTCFKAANSFEQKLETGAHMGVPLHILYKDEFVKFIRFFCKDISETNATDIFMNITKKLLGMLQKPLAQDENKNPMANSRKNQDLADMGSPTMKQ